jgi:hypothetical protein
MAVMSTVAADRFFLYRAANGAVRVSALELAGLRPAAILRLSRVTPAPADALSAGELDTWLTEVRADGITAEIVPA